MTAAWFWARAELRARWRSWLVLGILAGATAGIAAAGVAGARRTEQTIPRYIAAAGTIDAAVLPNDPTFDAEQRAAVAALPQVTSTHPFAVPFLTEAVEPRLGSTLLPTTASTSVLNEPVILEGRHTDPSRADEVVIDENIAERHGLGLGDTIDVAQDVPPNVAELFPPGIVPPGAKSFRDTLRVVGINKSVSSEEAWSPSAGFWKQHDGEIVGIVNMFVSLDGSDRAFERLKRDVERIAGRPVNVERGEELLGFRKLRGVIGVERDGLLLFALAALLGGGVLVGQALVRATTASGADLATWRAMGADRPLAIVGMALPSLLTALTAVVTAIATAIAVSTRFPIGLARRYDLDLGVHADWLVLVLMIVGVIVAVAGIAAATAWWRTTHAVTEQLKPSRAAERVANVGASPALLIGSRLAVEPGRGRRAVPVRSALVGAVVGVIGVVACFTFRAGIEDAAANPRRSGVVWDYGVAAGPAPIAPNDLRTFAADPAVGGATHALWARALPVDGVSTSAWGVEDVTGTTPLVVVDGRVPRTPDEIAFAPTTRDAYGVDVGDRVTVGKQDRTMKVVGTVLVPSSSHTDYDAGALLTLDGMSAALGADAVEARPDDFEDYLLLRWRDGVDVAAAEQRTAKVAEAQEYFFDSIQLPTSVVSLGELATMPLVLAIFFGLLACATVAHALVTTVRRRRFDLAILRAIGFTRTQARGAIAWQATILTVIGLLVGVPLGLVLGRTLWRYVAEDFPIAYVPPIELVVLLVVVPVALLTAQALAAGPAHAATRIRPAQTLRTE